MEPQPSPVIEFSIPINLFFYHETDQSPPPQAFEFVFKRFLVEVKTEDIEMRFIEDLPGYAGSTYHLSITVKNSDRKPQQLQKLFETDDLAGLSRLVFDISNHIAAHLRAAGKCTQVHALRRATMDQPSFLADLSFRTTLFKQEDEPPLAWPAFFRESISLGKGFVRTNLWPDCVESITHVKDEDLDIDLLIASSVSHLREFEFRHALIEVVTALDACVSRFLNVWLQHEKGFSEQATQSFLSPSFGLMDRIDKLLITILPDKKRTVIDFKLVKRCINLRNDIIHRGKRTFSETDEELASYVEATINLTVNLYDDYKSSHYLASTQHLAGVVNEVLPGSGTLVKFQKNHRVTVRVTESAKKRHSDVASDYLSLLEKLVALVVPEIKKSDGVFQSSKHLELTVSQLGRELGSYRAGNYTVIEQVDLDKEALTLRVMERLFPRPTPNEPSPESK